VACSELMNAYADIGLPPKTWRLTAGLIRWLKKIKSQVCRMERFSVIGLGELKSIVIYVCISNNVKEGSFIRLL